MPTVEAHVPTPRADRYLNQLCDHLGHISDGSDRSKHAGRTGEYGKGGHGSQRGHDNRTGQHESDAQQRHDGPALIRRVDHSGSQATIEFDWGTCDLAATTTR